jgi:hypothetical protein
MTFGFAVINGEPVYVEHGRKAVYYDNGVRKEAEVKFVEAASRRLGINKEGGS